MTVDTDGTPIISTPLILGYIKEALNKTRTEYLIYCQEHGNKLETDMEEFEKKRNEYEECIKFLQNIVNKSEKHKK